MMGAMDGIPMTTTPVDDSPPSDRKARVDYYRRLLAEDSPRGEFHRGMRDVARGMTGLELLCPECQEESETEDEESADSEKD